MKSKTLALLLTLLLALTLPLHALGEGAEPTYFAIDENISTEEITRCVFQLGAPSAPEEFVATEDFDGVAISCWGQREGEDVTVYFCSDAPFNPFGNGAQAFTPFTNVREVSFTGAVDASELSSLRQMFQGCSKLERIDFTGFRNTGLEDMSGMFSGCASLTSLDLRSFHIPATENVAGIFEGCTSLAEVLVNDSTSPAAIAMLEAEMGDCAAHSVTVERPEPKPGPEADASAVYVTLEDVADESNDTIIGVHFLPSTQGAPEGYAFDISTLDHLFDSEQTGTSWIEKLDEGYVIYFASDEPFRGKSSASSLFSGLTNAREIDLNGCFDGSAITTTREMLANCASLTAIDLSGIGAERVSDMTDMFSGCESLTTVDLSGVYISPSTGITRIFDGCPNLTEVTVNRSTAPEVIEALKAEMANCAGQTVTIE